MITFNDIFKSNFIENFAAFSMLDALIAMVSAIILGFVVFFVHKKTFSGVMYSISFGMSLIAMSVITSLLIVAVTSNVVLSLGMVGALSIVRFRAAIKEPIDIAFIFWSIAIGIVTGAGLIPLAVFGTIIVALLMILGTNIKLNTSPYVLVLSLMNAEAEKVAMEQIMKVTKNYKVKSKTVTNGITELTVEIYIKNSDTNIVNTISQQKDVSRVSLISFNGEYMG